MTCLPFDFHSAILCLWYDERHKDYFGLPFRRQCNVFLSFSRLMLLFSLFSGSLHETQYGGIYFELEKWVFNTIIYSKLFTFYSKGRQSRKDGKIKMYMRAKCNFFDKLNVCFSSFSTLACIIESHVCFVHVLIPKNATDFSHRFFVQIFEGAFISWVAYLFGPGFRNRPSPSLSQRPW